MRHNGAMEAYFRGTTQAERELELKLYQCQFRYGYSREEEEEEESGGSRRSNKARKARRYKQRKAQATVVRVAEAERKGPATLMMYAHLFWAVDRHWTRWVMTTRRRKFVLFVMLVAEATCREPSTSGTHGTRGAAAVAGPRGAARFFGPLPLEQQLPPELWIHILTYLPIAELSFR